MSPLRIVIADDHALLRELLCERLNGDDRFSVVASVTNAEDAFEAAVRHRPQVLLLDVDMPGRNAFEVARAITSAHPSIAIMFLSSHVHDRYIEQAVASGARGYVVKSGAPEEIVESILKVAQGGYAFAAEVVDRVVIDRDGVRLAGAVTTKLSQLSDREMEVLRYLAMGLSKKEVAANMHLSVKTIQNHADRLMQKLAIHDRVELARFAIREGVVNP